MANRSASTAPTPSFKAGPRRSMSPRQVQAYLLARETLRRLRRSATPCVPPDPSTRASPARDCQPALGRP
jgi:hypothetical protein